jgi:hypothetical protein
MSLARSLLSSDLDVSASQNRTCCAPAETGQEDSASRRIQMGQDIVSAEVRKNSHAPVVAAHDRDTIGSPDRDVPIDVDAFDELPELAVGDLHVIGAV